MSTPTLSTQQSADELRQAGTTGWLCTPQSLRTRIETADFVAGLALVTAIGQAAEAANHHPDLTLRYGSVDVHLTSHDVGGVTRRDLTMAATVNRLAADAGVRPSASAITVLELALDTPSRPEVAPFWRAVLQLDESSGAPDELVSSSGDVPLIWFQESGEEEGRQRWHLDVWVDPDRVDDLIATAEAAGGRLVSDAEAPSFWVLSDSQGNRVCLCTHQDR